MNLLPATENKKNTNDKKILMTAKFKNNNPKWCNFSIDTLISSSVKLTYHRTVILAIWESRERERMPQLTHKKMLPKGR